MRNRPAKNSGQVAGVVDVHLATSAQASPDPGPKPSRNPPASGVIKVGRGNRAALQRTRVGVTINACIFLYERTTQFMLCVVLACHQKHRRSALELALTDLARVLWIEGASTAMPYWLQGRWNQLPLHKLNSSC